MSANSEFVMNPKTSRPIKVGCRAYNELVREGVLFDRDQVDNTKNIKSKSKVLYRLKGNEAPETKTKIKKQLNQEFEESDIDYQAVDGRGEYKNEIVKRYKPPAPQKVIKKTKQIIKDKQNGVVKSKEKNYTTLEKMIMKAIESSDSEADDEYE